ncbi:MAG: hypothetical protein B7Y81_04225 [Caulobacter sp. 32-67-35]|nr:MAG: hypothetical protein B7Y81_04225 [Caulobacter sp. 32-67-35]
MQLHASEHASSFPSDRYVDVKEAASVVGLSVDYLNKLRLKGGGPTFSSFGRAVRYRLGNLYEWAASKAARSTSDREAA